MQTRIKGLPQLTAQLVIERRSAELLGGDAREIALSICGPLVDALTANGMSERNAQGFRDQLYRRLVAVAAAADEVSKQLADTLAVVESIQQAAKRRHEPETAFVVN